MQPLTTELLSHACRVFMTHAYPGGVESVPPPRQPFFAIPADAPLADFVCPAPLAAGIVQVVTDDEGAPRGYAFRLGSCTFPNLKLRALRMSHASGERCVFMVDTHDSYSASSRVPPPDHPDAACWADLQAANSALKHQIESAWADQGLATVNSILLEDLRS